MIATPSEILALAIKRHRLPWNWTLHFAGVFGLALTLLLHSYLMLAVTLIVSGAGFFELNMPAMKEGRWHRFVVDAIEWEKNWVAAPWNWRKIWRLGFFLLLMTFTLWALIIQEPVALTLIIAFLYLLKVVRENIEGGIDP